MTEERNLIQEHGLHRIDGPWHDYAEPDVLVTPEEAEGWTIWVVLVGIVLVALFMVALAIGPHLE